MTTKTRAFGSPGKYFQGPGEMQHLEAYTADYGKTVYAVTTPSFVDRVRRTLVPEFEKADRALICEKFGGQTDMEELKRLTVAAEAAGAEAVVGIGGGKALDAAKYVGIQLTLPIVMVPTIVSTDAPTSALSATYTAAGEHAGSIYYKRNPDVIVVDSQVIVDAPARFFAYGMGDALSTYFEAKAHVDHGVKNRVGDGYQTTLAAMALSELCYATLMAKGVKAYQDVVAHRLTQDVEDIIEVNTLLSGIGVESAGCAAAHALNSGFSALPECQDASHGEIVAFGTLCELVLEDWPRKTIHQVMDFNLAVGLPVTLADIGLSSDDKARLARVAQKAFTTKHIAAVPKATAPEVLVEAILRADRLGRSMRTRLGQ